MESFKHFVENKSINGSHFDHLAIHIDYMDKTHVLEIYDCDKLSDLDGEWPLAKKWENILKPLVKENRVEISGVKSQKGNAASMIS